MLGNFPIQAFSPILNNSLSNVFLYYNCFSKTNLTERQWTKIPIYKCVYVYSLKRNNVNPSKKLILIQFMVIIILNFVLIQEQQKMLQNIICRKKSDSVFFSWSVFCRQSISSHRCLSKNWTIRVKFVLPVLRGLFKALKNKAFSSYYKVGKTL